MTAQPKALCRIDPDATHQRCPGCGVTKPVGEFYRNKSRVSGRASQCKVCAGVTVRNWLNRHPGKRREYQRRWEGYED